MSACVTSATDAVFAGGNHGRHLRLQTHRRYVVSPQPIKSLFIITPITPKASRRAPRCWCTRPRTREWGIMTVCPANRLPPACTRQLSGAWHPEPPVLDPRRLPTRPLYAANGCLSGYVCDCIGADFLLVHHAAPVACNWPNVPHYRPPPSREISTRRHCECHALLLRDIITFLFRQSTDTFINL